MLKTSDFKYNLPEGHIAQNPLEQRDASRLLVFDRAKGRLIHRHFADLIDYLDPGDILVANDSRVLPARLIGRKQGSGGRVELLLLERVSKTRWRVLAGGKRLNPGLKIELLDREDRPSGQAAMISAKLDGPQREIEFDQDPSSAIVQLGRTPLPPYIHAPLADPERYQTIYARPEGSAAAPTAGLHFTSDLLLSLRETGVLFETITLHVGLDTFKPVEVYNVADHTIHSEWAILSPASARRINEAKLAGGRIIAVGTTSVRVLESAALRSAGIGDSLAQISHSDASGETTHICPWRPVAAFEGKTDLFIYPGYRFRAVDAMITNFHLPESSLLMLVSAFAGQEKILSAYETAVKRGYRFYSFGDAMLIQ
ncbi:MAG: tRNA preQ1(34) S-adenosylmethionine ribosyltransferase-isomerase QueA [Chloroflexota bacterium]|nr:MAG: tRNA preQ1(34) S-adenosylmethionine ribosyltransferase-isomerase QueA [Chloroflexota bacterium]